MLARIKALASQTPKEAYPVFALAAAIVVLAALLCYIFIVISSFKQNMNYEYATNRAYADAKEKFENECIEIADRKQMLGCLEHVIETAREPKRSEEDLNAQQQMADWARGMIYATVIVGSISIAVTIVGAYFVWRTLEQQRVASAAAVDAVNASVESNKINRDAMIANQRAWLSIEGIDITNPLRWSDGSLYLDVIITVKNIGSSPAVRIGDDYDIDADPELVINPGRVYDEVANTAKELGSRSGDGAIFPGKIRKFPCIYKLTPEKIATRYFWCTPTRDMLKNNAVRPIIFFCVDYELASHGERRNTGFVFSIWRRSSPNRLSIRECDGDIPAEDLFFKEETRGGILAT